MYQTYNNENSIKITIMLHAKLTCRVVDGIMLSYYKQIFVNFD
jgi:hypothetical protein